LFNETGNVATIFNGEIYNFVSLRQELAGLGHHFSTASDTEVIVHAYEEWGEGCFSRLNGMFALALWDGRSAAPIFYLARDKNGVKPLYYAASDGRLGFASAAKALMRLPWVSREVDRDALFHFLNFSHIPSPSTALVDIRQLEPGHYLRVDSRTLEKVRFWDPRSNCIAAKHSRGENLPFWEERFATTLRDCVRRQSVSDVPIGCFLSGGIDSSLLTVALTEMGGPRVRTFSIGYAEKAEDETHHARLVAHQLGTEHHELIVRAEDFRGLIADIPQFFDQPFADPTMLSTMLLSRFAREKVTVALSGDGADELFWGYPYQEILRRLKPLRHTSPRLRRWVCEVAKAPASVFSDRLRKILEILQFRGEEELFRSFIGMIGPLRLDRVEQLAGGKPARLALSGLLGAAEGLPWEDKIAYVFQNTFLIDTVLTKTDRASMAYGLEARVPFLDDAMLEFSAELPFSFKHRNGQGKFLLRRVLAKHLPPSITNRPKQGFSVPMKDWLRGDLRYLLDDHIIGNGARVGDWLDLPCARKLAREHVEGRRNHQHLLWSIVCLSLWKERYVNQ
jgi:asparagine synthase (glutamine-hydrolysing)